MNENINKIVSRFAESKAKYLKINMVEGEILEIKKSMASKQEINFSKKESIKQTEKMDRIIAKNIGHFHSEKITKGMVVTNKMLLGSIVAMGIHHDIYSPINGVISEIFVNQDDVVEYGQELFLIKERQLEI